MGQRHRLRRDSLISDMDGTILLSLSPGVGIERGNERVRSFRSMCLMAISRVRHIRRPEFLEEWGPRNRCSEDPPRSSPGRGAYRSGSGRPGGGTSAALQPYPGPGGRNGRASTRPEDELYRWARRRQVNRRGNNQICQVSGSPEKSEPGPEKKERPRFPGSYPGIQLLFEAMERTESGNRGSG